MESLIVFKNMKIFFITCVGLSLSCLSVSSAAQASRTSFDGFQFVTDNKPAIDKVSTVYSGETIIQQRTGVFIPCIVPKETWSSTKYKNTVEVKANRKICMKDKSSAKEKRYTADYLHHEIFGVDDLFIQLIEKKGKSKFIVYGNKKWVIKENPVEGVDYESASKFISVEDSFQQSIEYVGRKGSILVFIYSEFKGGWARNAFTREFSVDLNEGKMGGFKGAIFEVVEATNFEISYKIKRHFP